MRMLRWTLCVGLAGVASLYLASDAGARLLQFDLAGGGSYGATNLLGGTNVSPFSSTSVVTLDTDANDDGVEGDVGFAYPTSLRATSEQQIGISVVGTEDLFALSMATGTLSGHEIFWNSGSAEVLHTRTAYCYGPYCAANGTPEQAPLPTDPTLPTSLGYWLLSDDLTRIVGSTPAVFSAKESLTFGFALSPVPEPSAGAGIALILLLAAAQRARTSR